MQAMTTKSKFEKYPKYKNSGVSWFKELPDSWQLRRVKSLFQLIIEPAPKNNDEELLSVYTDIGVKPRKDLEERGNKASTTDGYWKVQKGDVIVNKLLAWMGAIGVSDYDGVTSPAYDILRARKQVNGRYFHYMFRMPTCVSELKRHSRGIMEMRLRLYFDKFGNISVPFPPLKEQTAIANFLDEKTTKIDQAIAQKEKMIALLKERKQIVIQNAVTKGLDPNVKMKDSGVDGGDLRWIGEIPEHWEVKRLKSEIDLLTGYPFQSNKYSDDGIKLARGINVKEGVFNWDDLRCWPQVTRDLERYQLAEGDVLIAMDGSKVGKNFCQVKSSDLPILLLQRVARLRPQTSLDKDFLYWNIANRNFLDWVNISKTDPMVPHIAPKDINGFIITLPPIDEQIKITSKIMDEYIKIDKSISLQQTQIAKLKEYKSTLIDSAVTGKIKVSKV